MLKGIFCDSVLRLLSSGAYSVSDFKFERRDVGVCLDGALAKVIKLNFFENYNMGDKGVIDPGFLTTFEDVPVLKSTTRNLYYSELPTLPIALERGLGIQEIAPMQDERSAFIPLAAGSAGLYKNLVAEDLLGEIGFRQQGYRAYYKNLVDTHCAVEFGVLIVMAASTLRLSMDDELPMPEDYLPEVRMATLNEMLQGLKKQDSIIDANSSTR